MISAPAFNRGYLRMSFDSDDDHEPLLFRSIGNDMVDLFDSWTGGIHYDPFILTQTFIFPF